MHRTFVILLLGLLPVPALANNYADAMSELGVKEPEFILHLDVENDFNTLGQLLTRLYLEYLKTSPEVPPIPVSFDALFHRLGLSNIRSLTMVSERNGEGFLNQALTRFEGSPQGLFRVIGDSNEAFGLLESGPADADLLLEMSFKMPALLEIVRSMAFDLMGPTGQGLVDAQLMQPVNESGMTWMDIINRIDTRIQFAASLPDTPNPELPPAMRLVESRAGLRLQGMGDLLAALGPMLQGAGFTEVPASGQTAWQLVRSNDLFPVEVRIESLPESGDLLLTYSGDARDWFLSGTGISPELAELMASHPGIPRTGLSFWYDSGTLSRMQVENMWADLEMEEKYAPVLAILQDFILGLTGRQVAVGVVGPSSHRSIALQPASYKTSIAAMGVIMPAAAGIGFIQGMQKSQQAQDEPDSPSE